MRAGGREVRAPGFGIRDSALGLQVNNPHLPDYNPEDKTSYRFLDRYNLAGRDENGEDAVRARGGEVHGRLRGGTVRVSEEEEV